RRSISTPLLISFAPAVLRGFRSRPKRRSPTLLAARSGGPGGRRTGLRSQRTEPCSGFVVMIRRNGKRRVGWVGAGCYECSINEFDDHVDYHDHLRDLLKSSYSVAIN